MGDFLSFRRMVTPTVIQVLFWIGVVVAVFVGLAIMGQGQPGVGLLVVLLGPLVTRIYCEVLILFFRMNETLTDILNEFRRQRPTDPPSHASETQALPRV